MDIAAGLVGVVCDDRPAVRRTAAALLERCGFTVAGAPVTFDDLLSTVLSTHATVAVITLPLTGMSSLAVVRTLRAQAPACQVVVLSAFETLELAALEAGAWALVPEEDPHALRQALLAVAAAASQTDTNLVDEPPQPGVVPAPRTDAGCGTTVLS